MKIAAIDFETATASRDSACALGAVFATIDDETGRWSVDPVPFYELVQPPENEYDSFNIFIHGITPEMTAGADDLDGVWSSFEARLDGHLLIAHNAAFDMSVLRHSLSEAHPPQPFEFACTYRLAKCTWPEMFSYRLDVLSEEFGIELGEQHHHAAFDAAAALELAAVICQANDAAFMDVVERYGFRLGRIDGDSYQGFSNAKPSSGGYSTGKGIKFTELAPTGEVDETHPIFGVSFAFTGTLTSMSRTAAAQRVVDCGGLAHAGPTKKTDFLVVGMTDFTKVRDGMSGKMRKALELAESGTGIEIIDEAQFLQMFI